MLPVTVKFDLSTRRFDRIIFACFFKLIKHIGVGRFRKLGAKVQNIEGAKLFDRSPRPNQCQIITFLTLKTDHIAKLRIELKSILLEIP